MAALPNDPAGEGSEAARAALISRLHGLWQSEPARYWPAFRASGLAAQDVWPDAAGTTAATEARGALAKPPGRK